VTSAKGEWHSQASWEFCPREEVVNAFAGFHPEVRTVIQTAPQLTKWPILDIEPVDNWSKGRLVLLGDACHAMMPYMASGAAMAMLGCGRAGAVSRPGKRPCGRFCAL
jgi:6-hydroxynicotinate 3-monooxygenase